MSKYQMVLPDQLATRMKVIAARKKIPLAQFIRETMEDRMKVLEGEQARPHLFERLRGRFTDIHETDLSSRVDEYLYGGDPHT